MFFAASRWPSRQRWLIGLCLYASCWPCLSSSGGLKVGQPNPQRNDRLRAPSPQGWSRDARRTSVASHQCMDRDSRCGSYTSNFGENCDRNALTDCCICGGGTQTGRCDQTTAILRSQSDVESLGARRCQSLKDLFITADVFDLSSLEPIKAVTRYFYVWRTNNLSDISGFEKLERVQGGLRISNNVALQRVAGLSKLGVVDVSFHITDNPALEEVAGFDSLLVVYNFLVANNTRLVRFQGFASLMVVNADMTISRNPALTTLGYFSSLKRAMLLKIEDLPELDSLDAFGSFETAGSITVANCPKIWSLTGLSNVKSILVVLRINRVPLKLMGGLTALRTVGSVCWAPDGPWPSCFTHQDLDGLLHLSQFPQGNCLPDPSFEPWYNYTCSNESSTCTRGYECKLDLDVNEGDVVFLKNGRCTGIPEKYVTNITRSSQQNVELDYFKTDHAPQPGKYSICVFSKHLNTVGPMSSLSVLGPADVRVNDCIRGLSCSFFMEGANLWEGDRIAVLPSCRRGTGMTSTFRDEHSLVRNSSGAYEFKNDSAIGELWADTYELCWPLNTGGYLHIGEMSFAGPHSRDPERATLGGTYNVNIAPGTSLSDSDSLWLFQKCGRGNATVKCTKEPESATQFSCLLPSNGTLIPGIHKLCWCPRHGDFCNRADQFVTVAGELNILCPEGEANLTMDSPCYKCPTGTAKQKNEVTCTKCRPGYANPELGSSDCKACIGPRSYASAEGAESCSVCQPWERANSNHDNCDLDWTYLITTCSGSLCLALLLTFSLGHRGKYWLIQEVSLSHERLIVTMPHPHGLRSSGAANSSFQVILQGTGWSLLDQPNVPWRASIKSSNTLLLHLADGQDCKQLARLGLHATGGWIQIRFPGEYFYATLCGVRRIAWLALLLAFVGICTWRLATQDYPSSHHWWVICLAVPVAAALAFSIRCRRNRRRRLYEIKQAKDREEQGLLEDLRLATWDAGANNTSSKMKDLMKVLHEKHGWSTKQLEAKKQEMQVRQSKNAGVSAAYMLSAEFTTLAQTRTGKDDPSFHDMKDSFFFGPDAIGGKETCPRDGQPGCSLIDTLPSRYRREATHFLSWTWLYRLSDVQSALTTWTSHASLDPEETFLYMCFFVNNQFRIIVNGTGAGSDNLEAVFEENLTRIGRAVSLLDTWDEPTYLTRIWTIFEVFKCLTLKIPLEMILPGKAAKALHNEFRSGEEGIIRVVDTLCKVDSSGAKAWSKNDEIKVKGMIQAESSFAEVDDKVRKALMAWVGDMVEDFMVSLVSDAATAPITKRPSVAI